MREHQRLPEEGVAALVDAMQAFEEEHGRRAP
jgi:hypothetical protein